MTSLAEMTGFEESINNARPTGHANSRDFSGPNWLDRRNISATYEDRDPDVLVVGGGQAGLSIAARLTQLGIDTLVVDQEERIGDNWRKRYPPAIHAVSAELANLYPQGQARRLV